MIIVYFIYVCMAAPDSCK